MIEYLLDKPTVYDRIKASKKPLLLYGMGNGAEKAAKALSQHGIDFCGVVASDGFARGNMFLSNKVMSFAEAEAKYNDFDCVLCFGAEGDELDMLKQIENRHTIYYPDLPLYGDIHMSKEMLLNEHTEIERVFDLLQSDRSREIFMQNLEFSITGDRRCLDYGADDFEMPSEYYSHEGFHVDIGAYDGDTAIEYASKNRACRGIIAVEPDKKTFAQLKRNTAFDERIKCVNAAAAEFDGVIQFASGSGRGSAIGEGEFTEAVTIDLLADRKRAFADGLAVGSIKIDAEGADQNVLCGAVNTLCDCYPVVSVAVYHRAGDLWRIPYYLHKLCGRYVFYLIRKPFCLPTWDTFVVAVKK